MTSSAGLHFKTYALIFFMVIFGPLGDVLLSKGMKRVGAIPNLTASNLPQLLHMFAAVFSSPFIWMGIASLLAFFVAYTLVLSWADYSYVQPASAIAYAIVALLGYFVLGEVITPTRWLGVLIICSGVFIVGHTPPRTTEHN
ncbi:MAG: EamA family transporter [Candidatus Acidiferrales bacterium]